NFDDVPGTISFVAGALLGGSQVGGLFRLQIGCFDHFTPFLGLLGEVLSEFGGRSNKRTGPPAPQVAASALRQPDPPSSPCSACRQSRRSCCLERKHHPRRSPHIPVGARPRWGYPAAHQSEPPRWSRAHATCRSGRTRSTRVTG